MLVGNVAGERTRQRADDLPGAPLAGLVRSTKADLTSSALGVVFLLIAVAWFAV